MGDFNGKGLQVKDGNRKARKASASLNIVTCQLDQLKVSTNYVKPEAF
jgi:hypothetical protein